MDDYISRDSAIEAVHNHFDEGGFNCYDDGQMMLDKIMDLPAAPVREVKRGRWVRHDDLPYSECPFCNARWSHITENFRYCFYCGAELREESE